MFGGKILPLCRWCELPGLHASSDDCLAALRVAIDVEQRRIAATRERVEVWVTPARLAVKYGYTRSTVFRALASGQLTARIDSQGARHLLLSDVEALLGVPA